MAEVVNPDSRELQQVMFTHVPELELPAGFRRATVRQWIDRIEATRRRSMVSARVQRLLDQADERIRPKKRARTRVDKKLR